MAVTSIWRVNGWLGKLVIYVENPEKTDNPSYVPQGTAGENVDGLDDVIQYAMNSSKTQKAKEQAAKEKAARKAEK